MRRLPSLAGVEAFVHVARSGSVKTAAEELALSSPALSRRIQALERFLDRPLFERRHQSVHLNEDGEKLMELIGPVMDSLSDAIETMTSPSPVMRLRLGVLPLFASQRLMPHLPQLRNRWPHPVSYRPHPHPGRSDGRFAGLAKGIGMTGLNYPCPRCGAHAFKHWRKHGICA